MIKPQSRALGQLQDALESARAQKAQLWVELSGGRGEGGDEIYGVGGWKGGVWWYLAGGTS